MRKETQTSSDDVQDNAERLEDSPSRANNGNEVLRKDHPRIVYYVGQPHDRMRVGRDPAIQLHKDCVNVAVRSRRSCADALQESNRVRKRALEPVEHVRFESAHRLSDAVLERREEAME